MVVDVVHAVASIPDSFRKLVLRGQEPQGGQGVWMLSKTQVSLIRSNGETPERPKISECGESAIFHSYRVNS